MELRAYERKINRQATLDAMLDAYSEWLRTKNPVLKISVTDLMLQLHQIDPHFFCELSFE